MQMGERAANPPGQAALASEPPLGMGVITTLLSFNNNLLYFKHMK